MANEKVGMDTSDIRRTSLPVPWPIMVMLVDDQPFVAATVRQQLVNEDDINFHYCQDPALAISTAEKIRPTVILLDFVMPEMDGLTLCRFFRAHPATRELPVIMLSSNDDPITKAQAFAAGANDYLVKLPDRIELIARLRYHSNAYISKLQRDDAYRALRASQMKLEELNMHLLKLANRDSLTGVANRRNFDERFAEEWLRSARTKHPISLVMFDIDLFKLYNDKFGHLEGDECLKKIAASAETIASRPSDLLARYGGEEFIMLLPETDSSGARMLAEKIRVEIEALRIPNPDSSVSPYITVSLGVATTVPEADSPLPKGSDLLLRMVDNALYEAKHAGRNQVFVAPPISQV